MSAIKMSLCPLSFRLPAESIESWRDKPVVKKYGERDRAWWPRETAVLADGFSHLAVDFTAPDGGDAWPEEAVFEEMGGLAIMLRLYSPDEGKPGPSGSFGSVCAIRKIDCQNPDDPSVYAIEYDEIMIPAELVAHIVAGPGRVEPVEYIPQVGMVLSGPHTQSDQLRVLAYELDKLTNGRFIALRTEAEETARKLDELGPDTQSEWEMDAHELGDRLACELDEIAGRHGLSFWINNSGEWAYRPIDSEENRAAHDLLG